MQLKSDRFTGGAPILGAFAFETVQNLGVEARPGGAEDTRIQGAMAYPLCSPQVLDGLAATGLVVGMSQSCSPILSVWARNVSGLMPTSAGRRCLITSPATRKGIRAERWARSGFNSGVDRQCDGQVTQRSM
jgi:hypothetical protein